MPGFRKRFQRSFPFLLFALLFCKVLTGTFSLQILIFPCGYYYINDDNKNDNKQGEYLGENIPLNLKVLEEFCKQHDFKGQAFDTSLRTFLASFKLPGEAQKIDRMMEAYAARYCACNPGYGI